MSHAPDPAPWSRDRHAALVDELIGDLRRGREPAREGLDGGRTHAYTLDRYERFRALASLTVIAA